MILILTKLIRQVIIVLLFLLGISATAQKEFTLQECINYAIANNLKLKDLNYAKEADRETYRQSVRNLLPSVGGYADYSKSYGRSEDDNTGTIVTRDFFSNSYSLNGRLDVFQGFKKLNSIRASQFLYKAAKEDVEQEKFLLSFRVMNAFYDIDYYNGLVEITKEQVEISQTNYDLVKKQIELGLKAKADLYEAESTLLKDKLELTKNVNLLGIAKLTLQQEMNYTESDSIVTIAAPIELSSTASEQTDSIYSLATNNLPLLKAQQLRVKASRKDLWAERGNYFPSVSLFANRGTGYFETNVDANDITKPFKTQFEENMSSRVGVQVEIPIFNKGAIRSRVKQKKIAWLRAQNNLEVQEQVVFQEIQKLVQENNALKAELKQSLAQLASQEQAFKIAQKKYQRGMISIMELGQAKTLFATSKNTNLQVQLKLKTNTSTLNFYKGISTVNTLINK